jgi:tRNA modification GTPase
VRVLLYPSPHSYTGEDAAELVLPANPVVRDRVIDALLARPGTRRALPGEFTARAFLNNRLSLHEAEAVGALIAAAHDDELAAARELLAGSTGERYRTWSDEVATLLALVEAGIDFTDQEDVVPISGERLGARAGAVLGAIEAYLGPAAREHAAGVPRAVLVGAPNSGKSTLFNALLGRRRAVASAVAGTTRDVLVERLDLGPDAPAIELADLPGLDADARGCVDAAAQGAARGAISAADIIVHCDPTGRFDAAPLDASSARTTIRVLTKADLPHASRESDALAVCALDRWNLPALKRALADAAAGTRPGERSVLVPRHRNLLRTAASRLREVRGEARGPAPSGSQLEHAEMAADSLRAALDALGELTGKVTPDDVLGRIFATFCVGK